MAAVLARAGTEIDQIVGRANRLLVVLDDEHGVAEVAQLAERREQPAVVALVQADRRLVEHVQHAGQLRSDLRREPDALAFAARERRGAAAERQIADADVDEEAQPIANLAQHAAGDELLALGELERFEDRQRLGDRQVDVVGDPAALDAHRAALGPQPLAVARRARPQRAERLERFLIGPGAFLEAAAQIRNHAFEVGAERILRRLRVRRAWRVVGRVGAALVGRGAPNSTMSRSFFGSFAERHVRIDAERPLQPLEHLGDEARRRPCAHGTTAPSASDSESSGTMRAGSKS